MQSAFRELTELELEELERLRRGEHAHPHHFLGLVELADGSRAIRLWRPGALPGSVYIQIKASLVELVSPAPGLFEAIVSADLHPLDYAVFLNDGSLAHDPYAFAPSFEEIDCYLFQRGTHYRIHERMGARCREMSGSRGVSFAVWAPNARRVSVVGDFNYWDGLAHPMRRLGDFGVWELFIPGLGPGERYKFELIGADDQLLIKADPYALSAQLRPDTASIVASVDEAKWTDGAWMAARGTAVGGPMAIYEVHLGSWRRSADNQPLNYRQIARELADYVCEMQFTHVELLPITEYPLDESWGYQVGGYFAATSRYGSLEDFQVFVDHLHSRGIGIILDWVPGHFVSDEFGLARFDGSMLYEHLDDRRRTHPHWGTCIFNYARNEVSNFLIGSALFWLNEWHIDGLRVDAVASMLYLNYGKEGDDWVPNAWGGHENLEAIEFLKHLNSIVRENAPGAVMIAEESTAWTGVTAPLEHNGLGFHLKWNMGWMNDTLRYFARECVYRGYHQGELTFGLLYAYSERFALPLSHDEVVHGKGSLLSKMPGDLWQKFANLRLLYSYLICQPGKKLLFMGGELGVWREWHCNRPLEWSLLDHASHRGIQALVRAANRLYLDNPPLWQEDDHHLGFAWIDFSDIHNCVVSYFRIGGKRRLACIHNFTPNCILDYRLRIPGATRAREIFNSDAEEFGGSGQTNGPVPLIPKEGDWFHLVMPPLATMVLAVESHSSGG